MAGKNRGQSNEQNNFQNSINPIITTAKHYKLPNIKTVDVTMPRGQILRRFNYYGKKYRANRNKYSTIIDN